MYFEVQLKIVARASVLSRRSKITATVDRESKAYMGPSIVTLFGKSGWQGARKPTNVHEHFFEFARDDPIGYPYSRSIAVV